MMGDLEQLLRRASSDLQGGVRGPATVTSSGIERRARRRKLSLSAAVTLLVILIGAGMLFAAEPAVDVAGQDGGRLITSDEILSDGVVTEAEYRAGAEAVVACLAKAGFEVEVSFDSPRGGATFSYDGDLRGRDGENEEFDRCMNLHLSENVALGWAATLGQLDISELRQEISAVVACVEAKTGEDFGELTFDEFDYLTAQGQEVRDAALEYQEHEPWEECYSELGLEPEPVEPHMEDGLGGSDALEIVVRSGLALTIRGPLDAPCIEVRSEAGMAGGCGVDLTKSLGVSAGGIGGQGFVSGWVSGDAAEVVVRLADGSSFEIIDLVAVEGFGVLFFLELVSPDEDGEIGLPIAAVALDRSGEEIGWFVLERDQS
jgi:hypothetical protein